MITLDTRKPLASLPKCRLRKVYSAYYDHELGKPHPMIRMRGKYLACLGFQVGDLIEVELNFGRITITKAQSLLTETNL